MGMLSVQGGLALWGASPSPPSLLLSHTYQAKPQRYTLRKSHYFYCYNFGARALEASSRGSEEPRAHPLERPWGFFSKGFMSYSVEFHVPGPMQTSL